MPGFNPFRYRFPYTNINDINLDWIIKKVKALSDAVASIDISRMDEIADQAETAQQDAETALATAQTAETTANSVQGIANNALSTAQSAETTAQSAETTANSVQGIANNALSTAQSAETTANSVQGIANNALSTAQSAETTAQSAQTATAALDANKADKVQNATNGNFAGLDADGNLTDSGHSSSDYASRAASVPPGGTVGQVLTKTGPATYATGWRTPSGGSGDVTADMLGIVVDGHATPLGADKGQYIIVKNSTIEGVTDGLYKAALAIPATTVIDATYLTAVSGGGLNSLGSGLSSLSTELGKFGKILYSGNFSGSGNISVPGIYGYALVGVVPAAGSGAYTLIGSPTRGGTVFGTYNSAGFSHLAYRFEFVDSNTIKVDVNNRGVTDGTNTTYSGGAGCNILKIVGLFPANY